MAQLMRIVAGGFGLCLAASAAVAVDFDRARNRMDPSGPAPLPPLVAPPAQAPTPAAPEAKPEAPTAPTTQPQASEPAAAPASPPQQVAAPAPPPLPDPKTVPVVPLQRVAAGGNDLKGKMFRVDGDLLLLRGGQSGVIRGAGKQVRVTFDNLQGPDSAVLPVCARVGTCRVRLMARLDDAGKAVEAVQLISMSGGGRVRF